jgi:hypothetical protein
LKKTASGPPFSWKTTNDWLSYEMKEVKSMTRHINTLCISAFAALMLSSAAFAAPAAKQQIGMWRRSMANTPRTKKGCFEATYPNTGWKEVPCTIAPNRRYSPTLRVGGAGGDFSGSVQGLLTSADGSFDNVTVKSEKDGGPNLYSLQLNSNGISPSPMCKTSTNSACRGWEQFIYTSREGTGFIQYWLIDYVDSSTSCPQGWNSDRKKPDCFMNSAAVNVGIEPVTNLANLSVTGTAGATFDTVTVTVGTKAYSMVGDVVLGLAGAWNFAEFGVFGDGDGTEAKFNPGTTIGVNLAVDNGTTDAPACVSKTTTGESNNLDAVRPCCTTGGTSPAISFVMTNGSAKSPCASSSSKH